MDVVGLIGIVFLVLVLVAPTCLMLLLVYHSERSRRDELNKNRRGFEVKLMAGERPVSLEERENDHG